MLGSRMAFAVACLFLAVGTRGAVLIVPSTWDPYLAGMPDGTSASAPPAGATEPTDVAPANRPTMVTGITFAPGDVLRFSATGTVAHGPPPQPFTNAEGRLAKVFGHFDGVQNGIGNMIGPANALVGLFLGPAQPVMTPAPAALDFSSASARDYATLTPLLKQPFFIGDGLTSAAASQKVVVPAGTTRLYLTVWDTYSWADNLGTFTVTVVPEPALTSLLTLGTLFLARRRSRFHRFDDRK